MALFSSIKKALGIDSEKSKSEEIHNLPEENKHKENRIMTKENKTMEESQTEEDLHGVESKTVLRPECSIYDYIKAHTKDGCIAKDFEIPWICDEWAPGAKDGVLLYHTAPLQPDPAREEEILKALRMMSEEDNGQYAKAVFGIFEKIEEKDSIIKLFDEIIRLIASHQTELNLGNLLNFGDWLICQGVTLLSVKLGLTVIAAFNVPFVEEVMTEFGVYDEFTYYAARVLSRNTWENGNEELFRLAKNVRGWGRIHAVRYIRPETPEIRDWLLYEGADNEILSQYSADICLQKAGAEGRLDSTLSQREFEAIGKLIETALESGPCPGITDGERILPKYLAKEKEFPIDLRLRQKILDSIDSYN